MKRITCTQELQHYIKLHRIDDVFQNDLSAYMDLVSFGRGEDILRCGEIMAYFYFVVEGKVKIYHELENGKSVLLRITRPLTELGSVEVLQETKIVNSNVQSIYGCKAIRIPFSILDEYAKNDATFYKYIVTRLSHKLITCSNSASMNVTFPFKSRFASYLISISTPSDVERIDEIKFDFLTDLATFLGTSYRHFNRVIKELEEEHIIIKNKKSFTIVNFDKLEALSGGYYE
jgi:CRP/FNR family transcriptional regulator, putaive post-exponential-phase nitrogen-starvation regulator